MEITRIATGEVRTVTISRVENKDFKCLTIKRYFFSWNLLKGKADIYKLCISGEDDILGLMALIDVPGDKRKEINLLACSKENTGSKKIYEGIAGCLIAFACREAIKEYGGLACVSLVPKTELKKHYISKYNMIDCGRQVFLEGASLHNLIIKYSL